MNKGIKYDCLSIVYCLLFQTRIQYNTIQLVMTQYCFFFRKPIVLLFQCNVYGHNSIVDA